ncbi:MAG TPA: hypothetical protein VGG72_19875 [Bryobacteraceae bacterium]|jgi:hypothetical protein
MSQSGRRQLLKAEMLLVKWSLQRGPGGLQGAQDGGPDRTDVRGVHPTHVRGWKKQALAGLPDIFGKGRDQMCQKPDQEKDKLCKQIAN